MITTHVLDTARGRPAAGIPVSLERRETRGEWKRIATAETDAEGRVRTWTPEPFNLQPGVFRVTFNTEHYFAQQSVRTFYPIVTIVFLVEAGETHYHVPLLLSPWGYTTYRGS